MATSGCSWRNRPTIVATGSMESVGRSHQVEVPARQAPHRVHRGSGRGHVPHRPPGRLHQRLAGWGQPDRTGLAHEQLDAQLGLEAAYPL